MGAEDEERWEEAKRRSLGQVLLRCARRYEERTLARLSAELGAEVRRSHTALFPHIDLEGTRITELARRVGISKQAVGQLVDELEEMGALERVPDPRDGRAKLVRFVEAGLHEGLGALALTQRELTERLGARAIEELHEGLLGLMEALETLEALEADQG